MLCTFMHVCLDIVNDILHDSSKMVDGLPIYGYACEKK